MVEERVSEVEEKSIEIMQSEEKKEMFEVSIQERRMGVRHGKVGTSVIRRFPFQVSSLILHLNLLPTAVI